MRETQGEKVSALVLFEQTVDRSAVASLCTIQLHERAAKGLGEGIMNHHGNKKEEDWTACQPLRKQVRVPGVPGSYPLQTSVASLATD